MAATFTTHDPVQQKALRTVLALAEEAVTDDGKPDEGSEEAFAAIATVRDMFPLLRE